MEALIERMLVEDDIFKPYSKEEHETRFPTISIKDYVGKLEVPDGWEADQLMSNYKDNIRVDLKKKDHKAHLSIWISRNAYTNDLDVKYCLRYKSPYAGWIAGPLGWSAWGGAKDINYHVARQLANISPH